MKNKNFTTILGALTILGLSCLIFSGCCRSCKMDAKKAARPLGETVWKLINFDGEEVETENSFELTFDDTGRYFGVGACNRFNGQYNILNMNGGIKMGPVASTRMACPDDYNLEYRFFGMFEQVRLYQFDADKLYLFIGNDVAAVFRATDKPVEK